MTAVSSRCPEIFSQIWKEIGINHNLAVPYTSEQNGGTDKNELNGNGTSFSNDLPYNAC